MDLHGALADLDEQPTNLGERLAIARHRLEASWGWRTLEVPLSQLCETPSFRNFAASLWSEPLRLSEIYNQALWDHRQLSHTKPTSSRARTRVGLGWVESPFWIWSDEDPRRRRLFVRCDGEALSLTNREGGVGVAASAIGETRPSLLPAGNQDSNPCPVNDLVHTSHPLRPFHSRYWRRSLRSTDGRDRPEVLGVELPPFTTATATVRLPVASAAPTAKQLRAVSTIAAA
ncbi:MAG: hypothetical protein R3B96_04730 [Pirellulaceae bacterium]